MRNISIRWQLIAAFAILSGVLVTTTVTFSNMLGRKTIHDEATERLLTLRDTRQAQLESFLASMERHLASLAGTNDVPSALGAFTEATERIPAQLAPADEEGFRDIDAVVAAARADVRDYYENQFGIVYEESTGEVAATRTLLPTDPTALLLQAQYISRNPNPLGSKHDLSAAEDGTDYAAVHAAFHPMFRAELERYEYYDIFLVDADTGRVVYSVFKEVDYATSLRDGAFRSSGLARAFESAVDAAPGQVVFDDFAEYTPSYEAPAAFMGVPIYEGDRLLGALVAQFPIDAMNRVMNAEVGLGETGHTIAVGAADGLLRSQLRESDDNTVLALAVDTEAFELAASGESGVVETVDYAGHEVIAAYSTLSFLGVDWVILAEQTTDEAFASIRAMVQWQLLVGFLLVVLGLGGGYFLARSIADPIHEVSDRLSKLADGRFAPPISNKRGDEVGDLNNAYNQLSTRLQRVIGDMQRAAVELSSSATQLMGNVQAQQAGATQQAAAVEETKQAVHVLLQSANSIASLGESVLENAEQAQSNAGVIGNRIHELSSNAANITEILNLIKDIANKSEMLALNAALEGTKAGDAGRGFSLVATQMQRLAEQVMGSVKRIESLTADINAASSASVLASEQAAKLATETTRSAEDITSAVTAQQAGTTEVDSAMDEVNEVARRSVEVAREMVSSANSLLGLSDTLQDHVATFDFSEVDGANTNTEALEDDASLAQAA